MSVTDAERDGGEEPGLDADLSGPPDGSRPFAPLRDPRRLAFELLLVALSALAGYVVAGLTGALVAGAAVVAGRLPSERPGAAVAMAGCVLLAGAAVASVVEEVPGRSPVSLAFPIRRPVAADLAAAAGVLLFAAVVTAALAERSPRPAAGADPQREPRARRAWQGSAALLGVGVVAFVVRLVAAPAALAAALDPVVESVAAGRTLLVDEVGLVAPAGPVLAALAPGGGSGVLVAVGVLVVGFVARYAACGEPDVSHRLRPVGGVPVEALAAGAVAAVLPSLWLLDLPGALAAAGALGAVALADPRRTTVGRAVTAGLLAGLIVLARPDTAVVGPVLVGWLVAPLLVRRRASRRLVRSAWAVLAAWVGVLGCWSVAVHGQTGGWSPFVGAGPDLDVGGGTTGGAVAVVLVLDLLAVTIAGFAVRRRGRHLLAVLPLVLLPVWAAGIEVVGGGEVPELLSWGAPFVAVLAGWQISWWWQRRPRAGAPEQLDLQAVPRTSA